MPKFYNKSTFILMQFGLCQRWCCTMVVLHYGSVAMYIMNDTDYRIINTVMLKKKKKKTEKKSCHNHTILAF